MTLQEKINAVESPIARTLLQNLYDELSLAIEVPNEWLPEAYHSKRGRRSLKSIQRQANLPKKISEHKANKREKARRVEIYRKQLEEGAECLAFDEHEDKLYRNEVTFCNLAIRAGWLSEDDFDD